MLKKNLMVLLCLLLTSLFLFSQDNHSLRINNREVFTSAGVNADLLNDDGVVIIQFHNIPGERQKAQLKQGGISLLRYLSDNAYLARVNGCSIPAMEASGLIRRMGEYTPDLKITPELRSHYNIPGGKKIEVYVRVYPRVEFARVKEAFLSLGAEVNQKDFYYNSGIFFKAEASLLTEIARLEFVDTLDSAMNRSESKDILVDKRLNLKPVRQQKKFKKADGANCLAGWWDGVVEDHKAFGNRVTRVSAIPENNSVHGNNTAGIVIASGKYNSKAKGIAPGASIYSYWAYTGEEEGVADRKSPFFPSEVKEAESEYGIRVSNNSWGDLHGWYSVVKPDGNRGFGWWKDSAYGTYNFAAFNQDKLAREVDVLIVRSSGNERAGGYFGPHYLINPDWTIERDSQGNPKVYYDPREIPDYGSVAHRMTSKNIIVVGAVTRDEIVTSFSNSGPTEGGVLKPDLVSQGHLVTTTGFNNEYTEKFGGTSSACPIVTGAAMLLDDYHYRLRQQHLSANMLKAFLIHSARDIGPAGPDYYHGFGVPDVELGAKLLQNSTEKSSDFKNIKTSKKNKNRALLLEGEIAHKERQIITVEVPQAASQLRATLVWQDAPGKRLINNLDFWITGLTKRKHRPFALDPKKPAELAQRKRNKYDNVEHILIENPSPATYRIYIKGAKIPEGPQKFALIFSVGEGNAPQDDISSKGKVEIKRVFITKEAEPEADAPGVSQLQVGDQFYIHAVLKIEENPDYGDGVFGSVLQQFVLSDSKGKILVKRNISAIDMAPGTEPVVSAYQGYPYTIPDYLRGQACRLKFRVDLPNGYSQERTIQFQVR